MENEWVAQIEADFKFNVLQDMKFEIKLAIRSGDLFLAWKLNEQLHKLSLLRKAE